MKQSKAKGALERNHSADTEGIQKRATSSNKKSADEGWRLRTTGSLREASNRTFKR